MAEQSFGILEILLLGLRAFGLFAAFAGFAWALLRMRREHAEQIDAVLNSQRELAGQNRILAERVANLGTLVATLAAAPPHQAAAPAQQPVEPLVDAPPPPRFRAPRRPTGVPSYETAKRMAREGASVEEIVASCGVAGTEARLLRRLHGARQADEKRRDDAA